MSEGMQAMQHDIADRAPKRQAMAQIVDEDDAVFWRDGFGLYAHVVFCGYPHDGVEGCFPVGGDLFSADDGALHLRVLKRKQRVVVLLLEDSPNGHGIIISRATTQDSNPVVSAGFRKLAGNFDRHNFDVYGDGEDLHVETVNGSLWFRVNKAGNFTVNTPDGGSLAYSDDAKGWKVKSGGGASVTVGAAGVCMRSPNGLNFLEVTNDGVKINGKTTRIDGRGALMLNMGATDTPSPLQAVAYSVAGPANVVSPRVFVGKT
jgi:hypothetical protein